ncbi:MAG: glycoside hydrolase family 2, partial [Chloroflexi bacterium]
PWQANFEDLCDSSGVAWYRRSVDIPSGWLCNGQAAILHFGAVDYFAEVWLNDTFLGSHEGGYLPFEFEVSRLLRETNILVVRVTDPSDNPKKYPNFPFSEIPHGKQSWYGQTSGLWQPIWLERRTRCHIRMLRLTPDLPTGNVRLELTFTAPVDESVNLNITFTGPDGAIVVERQQPLAAGATTAELTLQVDNPLPWSPDAPHLYHCEASLWHNGQPFDSAAGTCGFRTIETRDGHLYLNGQRFYMRGALDQDYYPDGICTPPSPEYLEDQLRQAKAMGLNTIRYHIKVADPRYLDVADRLGLLIWAEFPNFAYLSERAAGRAKTTLAGMVERDWNHPSIAIWTIINEDWGTNLVENEQHRAWLREMVHWLKRLDPTRLVVDNSPNRLSFHVETDIADYHFYQAHPDGRCKWDNFIERYAARDRDLLFSPNGDAVIRGDEPLIVSEFGVWGLPNVDDLIDADGREPFWMEYGLGFYDGVAYPHGIKDRFRRWHFDQLYGGWQPFINATQWRQYYALKYQIETIRRCPQMDGYVITELTDVHWEVNGLLDMQRNPRVFAGALALLNRNTLPIPVPKNQRVAFWAGQPVNVDLLVAHQQGQSLKQVETRWALDSGHAYGNVKSAAITVGEVRPVETTAFTAPRLDAARSDRLTVTVHADGQEIGRNHLNLSFFPRRDGPPQFVSLWTPDAALAAHLSALGYPLTGSLTEAGVAVLHHLTAETAAFGRAGGRVLLLADDLDAVGSFFPRVDIFSPAMRPRQREGTPWSGYWVTSFSWLRREGPFARIPGEPFLDQSFQQVMPNYVLEGFSPAEFEEHVYAGIFVGWVNKMAALIGVRRYGQGQVVLTTFRLLNSPPGDDPVATTLMDSLIELALQK